MFAPKSGIQSRCDTCRRVCKGCGGQKCDGKRPYCHSCSMRITRRFNRQCMRCEAMFTDQNNKTEYCQACHGIVYPSACVDCQEPITYRHKRCPKCSAIARNRDDTKCPGGWKRYEFNGTRYRSRWEIEVAKILEACQVQFEYERRDDHTKTRPDFYFPTLDRYLEIHPDYHGVKKVLPVNVTLVKSLSHARSAALAVAFRLKPDQAKQFLKSMSGQALRGFGKISLDLAVYLRGCMYERDGK